MKRNVQLLALLLCVLMVFCSCDVASYLPFGKGADETEESAEATETTETTTATEDSAESSASATTEKAPELSEPVVKVKIAKIYTADQLFTVLEASRASNYAESSQNTIYQLQCDIDLNEGWSAELTADGKLPAAPARVWTGIEKFYGTLDGQGHTISGIYMNENLEDGEVLAFIQELCGGTIKDLTIENSLIVATVPDEAQNVCVGAMIGVVNQMSTVENVTVNANVYVEGPETVTVSGTVAKVSKNALTQTNFTYGGTLTHLTEDPSVIKVGTAEQLLAALAEHGDFADKTLKLTANIDLNPDWEATVTIGSTVQFPQAPSVVWPAITAFKGVFDGNGYTISGIYSAKNVNGNSGAYGGLFNTLDGGTVKNLIIKNSFVLVTNSDWANDYNVHVGGIAGDVNAGSQLLSVYMDAEVWFKSWDGCVLGGAFGHANGQYTVNGFAFVGRLGNTGLGNDVNYASASRRVFIAQITGNQNGKDDSTIRNSVCAGDIYTGKNSATHVALGVNFPWKMKFILTSRLDLAWLESRSDYQDAGFVFSEMLGYTVPGAISDLLNNTVN